jgi:hypothetical protein
MPYSEPKPYSFWDSICDLFSSQRSYDSELGYLVLAWKRDGERDTGIRLVDGKTYETKSGKQVRVADQGDGLFRGRTGTKAFFSPNGRVYGCPRDPDHLVREVLDIPTQS